ncbi:universal stress protein UspA [Methylobacterium sp. Leaf111]|uniref:universal stress protein n=1 Tax=Methylobacterium sp. Leaf111 TaxID=1736257 RepID=UPI0006FFDA02|nr:universal stress protein [Methylobacterium sp. Leaf111]KQP72703.1 universal stress protein UspA [Methylobacterium sp. Leaf111]
MKISNVMVSLDLGAAAADRVQLSASLAERFDATLTGVAARQVPALIAVSDVRESERIYEIEDRRAREQLAEARAVFLREAGRGIRTAWRAALAEPTAYLTTQARAADMVVVGRHGPVDGDPGLMGIAAGALLMAVGRPVLVAPPGVERLTAKRIVVAWKDTRESRRAVQDALPFLSQAEAVHLVVAGPGAHEEGAEDVAAYLSGHGAAVTTHLLPSPGAEAAEAVLQFARRADADLIVMGAYGHTRLREWIFGGATRDVLQATTLCCLMSH